MLNMPVVTQMEQILARAAKNLESYRAMLELTRTAQESMSMAEGKVEDWQATLDGRAALITAIDKENALIAEGQHQICALLKLQEFNLEIIAQSLKPELAQHWTELNEKIYTTMEQLLVLDRGVGETLDMRKNNLELNLHRIKKAAKIHQSYQSYQPGSMPGARFLDQWK